MQKKSLKGASLLKVTFGNIGKTISLFINRKNPLTYDQISHYKYQMNGKE